MLIKLIKTIDMNELMELLDAQYDLDFGESSRIDLHVFEDEVEIYAYVDDEA